MDTLKTDTHLSTLLTKMVCGEGVDRYDTCKKNLLFYAISAGQPESVRGILENISEDKR